MPSSFVLWLFFLAEEPVLIWNPENLKWAALLIVTIASSILGAFYAGLFSQLKNSRPHYKTRLFNECLGKHLLAYFLFFYSISVGGKFGSNEPWMKSAAWCGALISLIVYGYGLYSIAVQEDKIDKHHSCAKGCEVKLPFYLRLQVWGLNLLFASLLLVAGLLSALMIRP